MRWIKNILLLLASNSVVLWVLFQASNYQRHELRALLARWTVLSQSLGLIVLALALPASIGAIRREFAALSAGGRCSLAGIFVLSLTLITTLPPKTNRIYFDEHIYENIAQGIVRDGEAWMCNACEAESDNYKVLKREYNKQPNGYPFYLSLFFRAFGISEDVAYWANVTAFMIGVLSVFGLTFLLFSSERAAFFAALCAALTPMNLLWSATAAVEPSSMAFSAFAVAAAALYAKTPSIGTSLLASGASGLAIYFRPESFLILAPVALIIFLHNWREIVQPRFYGGVLLFCILGGIEFLHIYAVINEKWGSSADRFSLEAFYSNIKVNGPYYYLNLRFPALFTVLAVLALPQIRLWKGLFPTALWFLYSWGIFLFFYAGSYDYGADVRFSLISSLPLAVLSGLGAHWVARMLERYVSPVKATTALIAVIAVAWLPFLPLVRAIGGEAADARFDVEVSRTFAQKMPPDSLIFSHTPTVWSVLGRNSMQTYIGAFDLYRSELGIDIFKSYPGGVFFHFGAWCNYADPQQNSLCDRIFANFETRLIEENAFDDKKRFSFYQIVSRKPEAMPNECVETFNWQDLLCY